mmetsp:Transcript_11262/g.69559  ORF Transcript_11262/g.69559 Transcript_11262/m.69559 type:complete len:271 (+) Transcript_11262:88-900(+)
MEGRMWHGVWPFTCTWTSIVGARPRLRWRWRTHRGGTSCRSRRGNVRNHLARSWCARRCPRSSWLRHGRGPGVRKQNAGWAQRWPRWSAARWNAWPSWDDGARGSPRWRWRRPLHVHCTCFCWMSDACGSLGRIAPNSLKREGSCLGFLGTRKKQVMDFHTCPRRWKPRRRHRCWEKPSLLRQLQRPKQEGMSCDGKALVHQRTPPNSTVQQVALTWLLGRGYRARNNSMGTFKGSKRNLMGRAGSRGKTCLPLLYQRGLDSSAPACSWL